MCKLQPLVEHNVKRCMESNGVSFDHYDPAEYDDTLTPGENITNILKPRGLRTRRELEERLAYWRAMSEDFRKVYIPSPPTESQREMRRRN